MRLLWRESRGSLFIILLFIFYAFELLQGGKRRDQTRAGCVKENGQLVSTFSPRLIRLFDLLESSKSRDKRGRNSAWRGWTFSLNIFFRLCSSCSAPSCPPGCSQYIKLQLSEQTRTRSSRLPWIYNELVFTLVISHLLLPTLLYGKQKRKIRNGEKKKKCEDPRGSSGQNTSCCPGGDMNYLLISFTPASPENCGTFV
jgi:hypothetical protein